MPGGAGAPDGFVAGCRGPYPFWIFFTWFDGGIDEAPLDVFGLGVRVTVFNFSAAVTVAGVPLCCESYEFVGAMWRLFDQFGAGTVPAAA